MKAHARQSPELSTKSVLSNENEAATAFILIQFLQTHFSLYSVENANYEPRKEQATIGASELFFGLCH